MSQLILLESDNLKALLSQKLSRSLGVEVTCLNTAEEAINLIKTLLICPLIITRTVMGQEKTAEKLYLYLSSQGHQESLIVLGDHPKLKFVVPCLPAPLNFEDMIKESRKKLSVLILDNEKEFLPVNIFYLASLQETPCDLYLRIKKADNVYQFVKLIKRDETIEKTKIEKYRSLDLKEVYVTSGNIDIFFASLTKSLTTRIEDKTLKPETRILATAEAYEIFRLMIREADSTGQSSAISKASIECMQETIETSPQIANLVVFLLTNQVNFAYQQCHLRTLICHHVLTKQSWYKKQHLNILTFASFFADVTLDTNEEMLISSVEEFDQTYYSEGSRFKVLFHPREAIDIAKNHPDFNDTIQAVILQSNGNVEGFGLEQTPSENLHPLSKIFIIADGFVRILLNPRLPSNKKEILELLAARYTNPTYKKIIKSLESKII